MAKKTTEDYERLLKELAQQRDDASAVANRALQENKILRQDVLHGMEILTALLRGDTAADHAMDELKAASEWLRTVGYIGGGVTFFVRGLVESHLQATNLLRAIHRAKYRPGKALIEDIKKWVPAGSRK
jgi:hypothetical protein